MNISQLHKIVKNQITDLRKAFTPDLLNKAQNLYQSGQCIILTQSSKSFVFSVESCEYDVILHIQTDIKDDDTNPVETVLAIETEDGDWDEFDYAALFQMDEILTKNEGNPLEYKQYSREGMIRRVLDERAQKARNADYRIKWANNIYGDHLLTNERGVKYKLFLRDFDSETGYSNSKDSQVNKLGTTKHLMFAFDFLRNNPSFYKRLRKTCPFIEVYCDPLNNYDIRYFYPHELPEEIKPLINDFFSEDTFIRNNDLKHFATFFHEAEEFDNIVIRPEVQEKIDHYLEDEALKTLQTKYQADYSSIKATLYDYQKEGIHFASTRKHAIIADEMGLGKTIQAIGTAVLKKDLFGFKKTLVVCPALLKHQWKTEIEKFSSEKAVVIQGTPNDRALQYQSDEAYFMIINYETILRDQIILNKAKIDFLILDEAQKVKNYATQSASAIKNVGRKHVLIITGTPIENKLIDLFSLMTILDPHLLGPLWEFSYQHCLFDHEKPNKINAYYNLANLKEVLKPILLRREKRKVIEQLPNVQQQQVPVKMTPLQADYHTSYANGIGQITNKKFLTAFDLQRLSQLLTAMRMVCDSTYLVDESTNDSPKLEELKYILLDKLDLKHENRKIIIFSEWIKVHKLIGEMLLKNNIGFAELNGSVPVQKRGELIKQFEENDDCKVFLSTEAGGAGLNLQVADTLINFELPWNPAKKNQRIGRIDRLGQKSEHLTIFNLVTENSIETRIALGLLVKQNLFDSVLNEGFANDFVDFTDKGRGQFLDQMKELANEFEARDMEELETVVEKVQDEYSLDDFKQEHKEDYLVPFEEDDRFEPEYTQQELFNDESKNQEEEIQKESSVVNEPEPKETPQEKTPAETAAQMEEVLNNGMLFLSGLMKMATGKDVGIENQKIEVDKETGEVTMKFKMPKF